MSPRFYLLLFFIYIGVATLPLRAEKPPASTYLVAVGISDYPGTANDLRLCVADVDTIIKVYRTNFTRRSSERLTVKRLTDSRASASAVLSLLRTTFAAARPEDTVVFYYSGHGCPGGFRLYDRQLSYDEVRRTMAQCKARTKIVYADACFAGRLRKGGRAVSEESLRDVDILLFLASRSSEPSREKRTMGNGVFTYCLQQALRGRADRNLDRVITARELFDYVRHRVLRLTNNKQHPVMWGNFDDNLPVLHWLKS